MRIFYDLIISTPTYRSVNRAIKFFLPTLKYLGGNNLCFIISCLPEDSLALAPVVKEVQGTDVVLFECDFNSGVYSINWTPMWCRNNGVSARYYAMLPDDDEFLDGISDTTIELLDKAWAKTNFSVATFNCVAQAYTGWGEQHIDGHLEINPAWIDGHYFIRWEDVFKYGLLDGPIDFPNPFFVDMEYIQRARILSEGCPLVVDTTNSNPGQFIFHHRQETDEVIAIRSSNVIGRISAGSQFWHNKYGIPFDLCFDCNKGGEEWARIFNLVNQEPYRSKLTSHLMFGGLWDEWDKIYQLQQPHFKVIASNCGFGD